MQSTTLSRSSLLLLALVTVVTVTVTGACDEAGPGTETREVNRPAAEAALALTPATDRHDPLAGVGGDELYIDNPTIRDIVEGRVQGPMTSSVFAMVGDEECPQERAARDGTLGDQPAPSPMKIDVDDTTFLDQPLSAACVRREADATYTLVNCDGPAERHGAADVFPLAAPANVSEDDYKYSCYFCANGFPCFTKRYQQGYVNQYWDCLTFAFQGCC